MPASRCAMLVVVAVALVVLVGHAGVAVSQQALPKEGDFSPVAGQWGGFVEGTAGSAGYTEWDISPTGRYSAMLEAYRVDGQLMPMGPGQYGFEFERAGQTTRGTLAVVDKDGKRMLVGDGRSARGPLNFQLQAK